MIVKNFNLNSHKSNKCGKSPSFKSARDKSNENKNLAQLTKENATPNLKAFGIGMATTIACYYLIIKPMDLLQHKFINPLVKNAFSGLKNILRK